MMSKSCFRAHGEPPETYELAKRNNIEIIDATCPVVLALQRRIKSQYEKGHQVADISLENKGEPVVVLPTRSQTENKCDEICSSSPVSTPLSLGKRQRVQDLSSSLVKMAMQKSLD